MFVLHAHEEVSVHIGIPLILPRKNAAQVNTLNSVKMYAQIVVRVGIARPPMHFLYLAQKAISQTRKPQAAHSAQLDPTVRQMVNRLFAHRANIVIPTILSPSHAQQAKSVQLQIWSKIVTMASTLWKALHLAQSVPEDIGAQTKIMSHLNVQMDIMLMRKARNLANNAQPVRFAQTKACLLSLVHLVNTQA